MFASDIGHWDVPDIREVLPEAWELVENEQLDEQEFADFTCGNVNRMGHCGQRRVLRGDRRGSSLGKVNRPTMTGGLHLALSGALPENAAAILLVWLKKIATKRFVSRRRS